MAAVERIALRAKLAGLRPSSLHASALIVEGCSTILTGRSLLSEAVVQRVQQIGYRRKQREPCDQCATRHHLIASPARGSSDHGNGCRPITRIVGGARRAPKIERSNIVRQTSILSTCRRSA